MYNVNIETQSLNHKTNIETMYFFFTNICLGENVWLEIKLNTLKFWYHFFAEYLVKFYSDFYFFIYKIFFFFFKNVSRYYFFLKLSLGQLTLHNLYWDLVIFQSSHILNLGLKIPTIVVYLLALWSLWLTKFISYGFHVTINRRKPSSIKNSTG